MHICKITGRRGGGPCLAGLRDTPAASPTRLSDGRSRPGRSAQAVVLFHASGLGDRDAVGLGQRRPGDAGRLYQHGLGGVLPVLRQRCGRWPAASGDSWTARFRWSATLGGTARWVTSGRPSAPLWTAGRGEHAAIHPPDGGQHGRASAAATVAAGCRVNGGPLREPPRRFRPGLAARDHGNRLLRDGRIVCCYEPADRWEAAPGAAYTGPFPAGNSA